VERRSVYVLVYALDPPRVLLLRRPESRAAGWQSVTGRVEPADADLAATALREIEEETGLPAPDALADLGFERRFLGYDGVTYHQRSFAARYATPLSVPHTPEHEEGRWVTRDEAFALVRWDTDREALAWLAGAEAAFK
jgi:8-oxo-dGTP pyrophosphatase MutT (NUDIX family)